MDTLIELIVQILVSLFSGNSAKPKPPTPGTNPANSDPAAQRRQALQQRAAQLAQRQQALAQQKRAMMRPGRGQPVRLPPPLPRPPAITPTPRPAMKATAPATSPAQTAQRPISADAIRQLITSRPASLRTIYVLSEVIQPPLALRQSN